MLHEPVLEVRTSPDWSVPDTVGAAVLPGAGGGGGGGAAATTLVATDVAGVEPAASVAVTTERMVCPASAATRVRVDAVAPETMEHDAPEESQVSHL